MKKVAEKIISITLGAISLLFVVLSLVAVFGAVQTADFDNKVVHALIIILTVVFATLTGINIYLSFLENDKLRAVMLRKDGGSSTKATVAAVKSTIRRAVKPESRGKVKKVQLIVDDNGTVRLRIEVKIKADNTQEVIDKMRALIEETFRAVMGIEFQTIDFKIVNVKHAYRPDEKAVEARVAELKKQAEAVSVATAIVPVGEAVAAPVAVEATETPEPVETEIEAIEAAEGAVAEIPAEEAEAVEESDQSESETEESVTQTQEPEAQPEDEVVDAAQSDDVNQQAEAEVSAGSTDSGDSIIPVEEESNDK
ncbi:MAG TPA: hypothetical protein IAB14_05930 [Candidatus Stercoripulliclostridium merdipullorum]|uniref:Alkaline shock response membrane anchor protein AmaP n=1 Tax=Candidatus Stercoripulliclostridium merdipullorum TaxID=2840952 RepID=A0A9D1NCQ5_9FIRM|nr:hypothetical protein [Candidatus Stercoripulliclostridium merdipullorum]